MRAVHAVLGSALKQGPLSAVIAELNRNSVYSFAKMIRSGVERQEIRADINPIAQAIALIDGERSITFAKWNDAANRVANALDSRGIVAGDIVVMRTHISEQ